MVKRDRHHVGKLVVRPSKTADPQDFFTVFPVLKPKVKPDSFTLQDLKRAVRKVTAAHAKA
jgi:hypothetical protein